MPSCFKRSIAASSSSAVVDVKFEMRSIDFPPGSNLVVYSDGISEAEHRDEQFGEGRLTACIAECAGLSADETIQCILSKVSAFIGDQPQPDDVTLLVVRRDP